MNDQLQWASAVELRDMIEARLVSPVEVVESCLARIDAIEPALHSFLAVAAERSLGEARRRRAGGRAR